jgi:hypothetical protein
MQNNMVSIFGVLWLIILSVSFFGAIVLSFYFYFKARNKERMALIEKGSDLSEFYKEPNRYLLLKIGMLFIGVAVGLFIAYAITIIMPIPIAVAYFGMILLFGGLGLILYYPVSAKYFIKNDDGK